MISSLAVPVISKLRCGVENQIVVESNSEDCSSLPLQLKLDGKRAKRSKSASLVAKAEDEVLNAEAENRHVDSQGPGCTGITMRWVNRHKICFFHEPIY